MRNCSRFWNPELYESTSTLNESGKKRELAWSKVLGRLTTCLSTAWT